MARIFWAANAQSHDFEGRITAARAGGYEAMSLFPFDVRRFREAGLDYATMRARLADAGLRVEVIDPFTRWLPGREAPASWSAAERAFTDFDEDAVFEMAVELRARCINVVEPFGVAVDVEEGAACLARVCDRARPLGLVVLLEAMPFSGIPDLGRAWAIVQAADRPNAALTFDVWHYLRAGADPALLSTIPGHRIGTVQIADGAADPGADLLADLYRRRLPGDGALPLRPLLESLHRMDALTHVGVEIFGPALTSLAPPEIGHRSRRALELALRGLEHG